MSERGRGGGGGAGVLPPRRSVAHPGHARPHPGAGPRARGPPTPLFSWSKNQTGMKKALSTSNTFPDGPLDPPPTCKPAFRPNLHPSTPSQSENTGCTDPARSSHTQPDLSSSRPFSRSQNPGRTHACMPDAPPPRGCETMPCAASCCAVRHPRGHPAPAPFHRRNAAPSSADHFPACCAPRGADAGTSPSGISPTGFFTLMFSAGRRLCSHAGPSGLLSM